MTQDRNFHVQDLFGGQAGFRADEEQRFGLPGGGHIALIAHGFYDSPDGIPSTRLLTGKVVLPEGGLNAGAMLEAVGFDHDYLPEPFSGALTLTLGEVSGLINGDVLQSLRVPIGIPGRHALLPGLLELEDPALLFQFDRPVGSEGDYTIEIELGAYVDVAGARMQLRGGFLLPPTAPDGKPVDREALRQALIDLGAERTIPDAGTGMELTEDDIDLFLAQYDDAQTRIKTKGVSLPFFIEGRLQEVIDFSALLGRFGWPALSAARVVRLDFFYHSLSDTYEFEGEIADALETCNGQLALEDIRLAVRGQNGAVSGELHARLRLGSAHMALSAQGNSADHGWLFRGSVTGVADTGLAALLEETFGTTVPHTIREFELDELDAEIDTASERLYLHASGRLPLVSGDGDKARATISVELVHDGDQWRETFSGHLTVDVGTRESPDELDFGLEASHDAGATSLAATFHDPNGLPFDVSRAIRGLWPDAPELPAKIDLHIPAAAIIHYAPTEGSSETVFALDVDGGLDLSNITLPSIPVPSGMAPSPGLDKLRLNVHLFAVIADHLPSEPFRALAAASDFPLPDSGSKEGGLIADVNFRFGETVISQPAVLAPPADNGNGKMEAADMVPAPSDGTGAPEWFEIDKRFGPLHVDRLGISMDGVTVNVQMEAALSMAGLSVSLDGLTLSAELTDLSSARFAFSGLGIDYYNPPLEIGGAFFARDFEGETGYAGEAILRTETLSLMLAGEFRKHEEQPSLLLFGLFDEPLGGPGFFFVTGLAAGLGYNRSVKVPRMDKVAEFPLVLAATSDQEADKPNDPGQALVNMGASLPPALGAHFLAVGVKFTSFKVVESFALLIGREHERLEFDLLGVSSIHQPYGAVKPLAKARIGWLAHFSPEEGLLTLRAEILPGAFVFDPACHLKGGFAASFWFTGQVEQRIPAGDFALTLGGYHPAYQVPKHYPRVTPLTLEWQVNKHLRIKGQAYMALTSHAIMAGGRLEATWHDTDVRVHFVASADFLLCWEPYHYDIQVNVSLRASVTVHVFTTWTINFDASARLHLWGPEFSGEAEIHLKVLGVGVAFHVAFNKASKRPRALGWPAFCEAFVPAAPASGHAESNNGAITLACGGGLLGQTDNDEWIIAPALLTINIACAVPVTHLQGSRDNLSGNETRPGIAPMGIKSGAMRSDLRIVVKGPKGGPTILDSSSDVDHHSPAETPFRLTSTRGNVPAATFGPARTEVNHGQVFVLPPRLNDPSLVEGVTVGAQLQTRPLAHHQTVHTAEAVLTSETSPESGLEWARIDLPGRPRVASAGN